MIAPGGELKVYVATRPVDGTETPPFADALVRQIGATTDRRVTVRVVFREYQRADSGNRP